VGVALIFLAGVALPVKNFASGYFENIFLAVEYR
jgi:hypothetical protein